MTTNKTFKDFAMEDLDVFFNVDEMGSEHELEGEILTLIVVENQSDNNMTGFSREQLYGAQEVSKNHKVIYVKSTDYYVPNIDSILTLDKVEYYVEEASEDLGMIRILVSLNES